MSEDSKSEAAPMVGPKVAQGSGIGAILAILLVSGLVFAGFLIFMSHYTDARVRRTVALVNDDLRTLAAAVEAYWVDNGGYPAWAKDRADTAGAYVLPRDAVVTRGFRMRNATQLSTLTTPVAYMTAYPVDPFREYKGTTYSYYAIRDGFILGSWGPDVDQRVGGDLQWHAPGGVAAVYTADKMFTDGVRRPSDWLLAGQHADGDEGAFTYDPTNGLFSEGDLWRIKQ